MIPHPATPNGRRALACLVDDILTVWPDPALTAAWSDDLVARLRRLSPNVYRGLDVRSFGGVMRSIGIPVINIRNGVHVRRGVRRADLGTKGRGHPPVVYFAERHGFVKIGTTTNLTRRVDALDRGDSAIAGMLILPVTIRAVMPGDHKVEYAIHELFQALRYDGEWFLFDEPLVGFVESVAAAGGTEPNYYYEMNEPSYVEPERIHR